MNGPSRLFTPLDVRGRHLRNRLVMGSMHTGLEEVGGAEMAAFYRERAAGGAALIVTGGIAPETCGAVFPGAAAMAGPEDVARHRPVTEAVHAEGALIAMQLLHAGRYAMGRDAVAPSAIRAPISPVTPREMTGEDIEETLEAFAMAARLAVDAGYDGVELMGSEGYLINQFLAPRTNRRSDGWGGSAPARRRFAREVIGRVRAAIGPRAMLIYRMSLVDLVEVGQSWDEVLTLAAEAGRAGVDIFDSGIGWHESRVPTIAAAVPRRAFAWASARLRAAVPVPVMATNRIMNAAEAEAVLDEGAADLVAMARPWLAAPALGRLAAEGRADHAAPCIACNQSCLDRTFEMKRAGCLVNPRAGQESRQPASPADPPRRIAVVGAGPAGLSCALGAAERGHAVTLFETQAEIGGQMRLARVVPGKGEFAALIDWFAGEVSRLGVRVELGRRAAARDLDGFDAVVLATGVRPRRPELPVIGAPAVLDYAEALGGAALPDGPAAIIGAGGVGFDVATWLTTDPAESTDPALWRRAWGVSTAPDAPAGLDPAGPRPPTALRAVTLMQRGAGKPGAGLGKTTGWIHRAHLRGKGVEMLRSASYRRITPEGVHVDTAQSARLIPAALVVICAGQEPERALAAALPEATLIGGAREAVGIDAERAIREGAEAAAQL